MDTIKQVQANIKIVARDKNLSDAALALKSGIPYSTLYRKLAVTGDFKLSELARLADALEISPADLYKTDVYEQKLRA